MNRVLNYASALATSCALAMPVSARAQKFELSPFAGAFVAPTNIAEARGLTMHQQPGFLIGARGTWWKGGHYGAEATFAYVRSNAKESGSSTSRTQSAQLGASSIRLAWRPDSIGSALRLSGGLGMVAHGGTAYGSADGRSDLALALGAGWRVPISGTVAWRVDLDDYLYSASFGVGSTKSKSKLQSDVLLSVGVIFRLGQ
ncbi:MAG: hypothetical protein M3081_14130 [Gemmatimonadota bacterium]|nr:hypothetical protein [Gemmatimonadota bacterium]